MRRVVSYQAPGGGMINICSQCQKKLKDNWPRDGQGREYCQVSIGAHRGRCHICESEEEYGD